MNTEILLALLPLSFCLICFARTPKVMAGLVLIHTAMLFSMAADAKSLPKDFDMASACIAFKNSVHDTLLEIRAGASTEDILKLSNAVSARMNGQGMSQEIITGYIAGAGAALGIRIPEAVLYNDRAFEIFLERQRNITSPVCPQVVKESYKYLEF